MKNTREWLEKHAALEEECSGFTSVGGLAHDLGMLEPTLKIWIDDIRSAPDGYIHLKTQAEFEAFLINNPQHIHVLDLDHDLGEGEPTGYDIIKWLHTNLPDRFPTVVACHSSNPPGKMNILAYAELVHNQTDRVLYPEGHDGQTN